MKQDIAGTTMFDGDQAQKGFALNRMCFSFNSAANRAAFLKDEDGYCRKYGLNEQQRAAIEARNVLKLIEAGGNVSVQHPLPSMARCLKLGRSVGRAIKTYPQDLRVVVVGTGGLSHQLDGARAGFINKEFDQLCLDKIVNEPDTLTRYSIHDLVALSGVQGVEFLNWMAMRGALTGQVTQAHRNYHVPISNTAAATIVLDNHAQPARKAA